MPNPLAVLLGALRFRASETKQSRVAPMIALHMQGRAVWTPRDYAALADEVPIG